MDLQTNVVTIEPTSGAELDLAAIPRRVRDSGFTPGEMRLAARGEVHRRGDAARFQITPGGRSYPLAGAVPEGQRRIEASVRHARELVELFVVE